MVICKNLYQPNIIAKEEDQYPNSTYELEGYVAYSWGKNIPKINTEIDKTKLLYTANYYIHSVCINCSQFTGTLTFHHVVGEFKEVKIENTTITFTGKPGSYLIPVDWIGRQDGGEDIRFYYPVIIYPDKDRTEYLKVLEYLQKQKYHQDILNQFKSSVELWKQENNDTTTTYLVEHYYSGPYYETYNQPKYFGQQLEITNNSEEL